MKQLRSKMLELGAETVLTREQMKEVTGGSTPLQKCLGGCSVGSGSVVNGTWKITNGSCGASTVIGQGGATVTTCNCSVSGTAVTNCSQT